VVLAGERQTLLAGIAGGLKDPQLDQEEAAHPPLDDLDRIDVTDREHWQEGPPHEIFKELRGRCPVHWSEINEYPNEEGFWSVVLPDHVRDVSLDWETYSSERGGVTGLTHAIPLELARGMFIAQDPPKHDRLKMLFQRGFTPKRIAEHEDRIRAITERVLDGVADRGGCDLVTDVAQPVVSRVIGSFMGIPEEDDAVWARLMNSALGLGDDDLNPGGLDEILEKDIPEIFERCRKMIEERRENPTDDLTSVLVHAEIDGEKLEEHEIVMGFFLLVAAGNDSTKATYTSGMRALLEHPEQMRMLVDDPSLIPGAVEECLRMYPAFAHFRRTATRDTEIAGQPIAEGDKVACGTSRTRRGRYEEPDRFDVLRNPEHQPSARVAATASGRARRPSCGSVRDLRRFPEMELAVPEPAVSAFLSQLRHCRSAVGRVPLWHH
jgi:cholest-4-en-3-one 26-monooxygenase